MTSGEFHIPHSTFGDSDQFHEPVMVQEAVEHLRVESGVYVDATIGGAGHSEMILKKLQKGRLVGIDLDEEALGFAGQRLEAHSGWTLVHGNFAQLEQIVKAIPEARHGLAGVLFDLGVSRHQVVTPSRGFSYHAEGPLDMRFSRSLQRRTAFDIVRQSSEREIGRIIQEFGEERYYRRLSRRISQQGRQLRTTASLADAVRFVVPGQSQRKATMRVFQAFRIAVNDELENLRQGLRQAIELLARGGRIVVIAYHSLEDRIVKQTFRDYAAQGVLEIVTRKPLRPCPAEVAANPSARSARLRAARKIGTADERG